MKAIVQAVVALLLLGGTMGSIAGDVATGLATVGQFLGLPEMNLSEQLTGSTQQTQPAYTGSGVFGSGGYITTPTPGNANVYPSSGGVYTSGPYTGQSVGANGQGTQPVQRMSGGSSTPNGQSTSRGSGGGGGDSRLTQLQKMQQSGGLNPSQQSELNALIASQTPPAPDMTAIVNAYNAMKGTLEGMKGDYQNSYQQGLGIAQNTLNSQLAGIDTSKTQQQNMTNQTQNTLLQNLLQQQAQNRGAARAFGGYSSGFEQGNTRLQQGYGTNYANMQNDLATRLQQLDQAGVQAKNDYAQHASDLYNTLQGNLRQIALNENQTDLQKVQSLQQAQQTFNNNIAAARQQYQSFVSGLAQMQAQTDAYRGMYSGATSNFNPAQYISMAYGGLGGAGTGPQTAAGGVFGHYDQNGNWIQG